MEIEKILKAQRRFFAADKTKEWAFREKALERLERGIRKYEGEIRKALYLDLHKSSCEAYMTEIGMALSELSYVRKHLKGWMKCRRVLTPAVQFPADSFRIQEPYGTVLIMAPWNYPFLLTMEPLIGAIGAGNCCVVKPSAYAPRVSQVLADMLGELFPEKYIAVVQGGREENQALLEQRFDYIFFTGGTAVGKEVMRKAAGHLTPVTLELGGKSPCIVDETADLDLAAKRLVFGKFLNCGQTCVAPDYLLVQESVKAELMSSLKKWIHRMYGDAPLENPHYPRMVNEKHYDRVMGLMKGQRAIEGGYGNRRNLQIAPTVLEPVSADAPVMQEEIFGPVLPVLTYQNLEEAVRFIKEREKPLALYFFTGRKDREQKILRTLSFGGGCINDTIIHLASSRLAFGGVGASGMGSYHGRKSFETFSHEKSIMKKYNWLDLPIRYQPYNKIKEGLIRRFL